MKKTAFAVIFAFELLSLVLVGIQSVDVAHGNGIPFWEGPATPPPVISVISPTNKIYENEVILHLNITAIDSHQNLRYVDYTLDGEVHLIYPSGQRVLFYYKVLEGLSEGTHSLKVYASCKSYLTGELTYSSVYGSSSDVIYFTVVYPPVVSILSLENKVYKTNNIPLDFAVDEPASKIEYCIDGKERIVIDGNVTLTGLSNGLHNVVVYATDVDGHVGVSETSYFEIEAFPTLLVLASVSVVAVIVGLGLLVYFIKRR